MYAQSMIQENMRVLVRGDKPDQEIIGQVVRVSDADEAADGNEEALDHMRAMHITHIAAIMTPETVGTFTMFKVLRRDGEWYLPNGEHLTIETIGVHRG